MKSYQKTALFLIGASFLFSVFATIIPDSDKYQTSPIDNWFSVMSVVTAICAAVTAALGWARDNL